MKYLFLVAFFSLTLFSAKTFAAESQTIHGRLTYANGNPSRRIWIVKTTRILGVRDEARFPSALQALMSWDREIYGDFTVTPLTPYKKGTMQIVQIDSVKNVVVVQDDKIVKRIKSLF